MTTKRALFTLPLAFAAGGLLVHCSSSSSGGPTDGGSDVTTKHDAGHSSGTGTSSAKKDGGASSSTGSTGSTASIRRVGSSSPVSAPAPPGRSAPRPSLGMELGGREAVAVGQNVPKRRWRSPRRER